LLEKNEKNFALAKSSRRIFLEFELSISMEVRAAAVNDEEEGEDEEDATAHLFLPLAVSAAHAASPAVAELSPPPQQQQQKEEAFDAPMVGLPKLCISKPARVSSNAPGPAPATGARPRHSALLLQQQQSAGKTRMQVQPQRPKTPPSTRQHAQSGAKGRAATKSMTMREARSVSWHNSVLSRPGVRGARSKGGEQMIDLTKSGLTHRAYIHSSSAVINRRAPQRPEGEEVFIAVSGDERKVWSREQDAMTRTIFAAYGSAGGAAARPKKGDMQAEGAMGGDEVRKEWVPKVRKTVRAVQETMRLKNASSTNPRLLRAGQAAEAREEGNLRQERAVNRMQAVARGLSARRVARTRMSHYRARLALGGGVAYA
jgi:hypothetical protein